MGPRQKTKTPNKQVFDDISNNDRFSPIKVKESPTQNRQGNLTGSARKLKDGAADLHNLTQKWETLSVDGANIVSEIANIKTEKMLVKGLNQSEDVEDSQNLLPESLLPLCEKLENLLKKMEKISVRLTALAEMAKGVAELEHFNNPDDADMVLFQTWTVDKFVAVFQEIAEMYGKELKLKQSISENICHGQDRNIVMFYTASWVHEPYVEPNIKVLLESMLFETRHKT